ncbi:MAG: histidine phosphatase family protein [Leptospirales bacterium]
MKYLTEDPHPDRLRFFLLRHGHLENSERAVINGSTDIPLSDRGRRQMHFWKEELKPLAVNACVSSNLHRTIEGMEILTSDRDLVKEQNAGFRERSFGIWEGKTRGEISAIDPEGYVRWQQIDLSFEPTGGESLRTFHDRISQTLEEYVDRTGYGKNVLMVGHSGVNRILLLKAMGLSLEQYFRFSQDYAALNIIDFFRKGPPIVHLLNCFPSVLGGWADA